MYWRLTPSGEFTTKYATLLIQGITPENIQKCSFRLIWKIHVPPKVSNFIRKICNDGLSTKERLFRSHVVVPLPCVFCNHHTETTHHLLLDWPFSKDLFMSISQLCKWLKIKEDIILQEDMTVILNLIRAKSTLKDLQKIMISWWFIWFFRNNICFSEWKINVQNAWIIVKRTMKLGLLTIVKKNMQGNDMCNKFPRSTQPIPCQVA